MIPSWCKSQAWLSMFKTARLGGAPGFMASLGLDVPEWLAYGPVAIIIVLTFIITPIHTCWYPQH